MILPPFEPSIGDEMRADIVDRLAAVESDFGVRILFAIESGSRAWGFPSPDSDYDVRFVYAHPTDWYLSLTPGRDVIELPIADDLDIGGWDLRKALKLLLRPNPVLLEWLSSPIRYRWDEAACASDRTDGENRPRLRLRPPLSSSRRRPVAPAYRRQAAGELQEVFLRATPGSCDPLGPPQPASHAADEHSGDERPPRP